MMPAKVKIFFKWLFTLEKLEPEPGIKLQADTIPQSFFVWLLSFEQLPAETVSYKDDGPGFLRFLLARESLEFEAALDKRRPSFFSRLLSGEQLGAQAQPGEELHDTH